MAILTLAQLRQFVDFPTGTAADTALQQLLDASEADILAVTGALTGNATELVVGGWSALIVSRPMAAVVTVTDDAYGTPLVLAADDYRFSVGGYVLHRLSDGTNPGGTWGPLVRVVYTPAALDDQAVTVQVGLIRLVLNYNPGLLQQDIGDWSETYQTTNSVSGYAIERAALLASLTNGPLMVVI